MEIITLTISILTVVSAVLMSVGYIEGHKERAIKKITDKSVETYLDNRPQESSTYSNNVAKAYQKEGLDASDSVIDYSCLNATGKQESNKYKTLWTLDQIYDSVNNIKTHVVETLNEHYEDKDVVIKNIDEYVDKTVYLLESRKFIAKNMLMGILANTTEFQKNINNKHNGRTLKTYVETLTTIIDICDEKYKELDKIYGSVLGKPQKLDKTLISMIKESLKK
ncbi:MAG: hypothetical protein K0B02_01010 [DPANN group archaeon]|nr:hypothetical protein [DPANN group archaeon]